MCATRFIPAILLLAAAGTLQAGLLTNGSFEQNAITASPWYARSFSSLPGWTQYADGVDVIHNNYVQSPSVLTDAQDGVQFLDMNQASLNGGVYQVVTVTPGTTYRLTLYVADWASNGVDAQVTYSLYNPGDNTTLNSAVFGAPVSGQWYLRTLEATATSSQLGVRIYGSYATQAGAGVDNVSLDVASPEPSTAALAGIAIAATAATIRSRRKAART